MSKKNLSLRSNLYWNTAFPILSQGFNFVFSILLARVLMPSDFGIIAIAMMVIGYANLLTDFGFNQVLIQKRLTDIRDINCLFTLGSLMAIFMIAVSFLSAHHIAIFFNSEKSENVIKLMSSTFIITTIRSIAIATLQRDLNFKTVSLINALQTIITSVLTLALAINGMGYWAIAWGQLMSGVIVAVILCVKVHWWPWFSCNYELLKKIVNFSAWNYFRSQINFIAGHVETFIIGKYIGTYGVGIYDKAASFAVQPQSTINMNINAVFFSSFCSTKNNQRELQEQFKKSLCLAGIINLPIYFGLIAIAPYFVTALLGQKWEPMIVPIQILSLAFIFNTFTSIGANLNVAIGKYSQHTVRLALLIVILIVSALLLLDYGIVGIACAAFLFNLLKMIFLLGFALKNISLSWLNYVQSVWPPFVASLIMFLVVSIASFIPWLKEYTFVNMLFLICIGVASYILYSVFIDRAKITEEFKTAVIKDIRKVVIRLWTQN